MASIEIESGRIGFAERGSGGVPILFLHGVGSDKKVWRPQLDHFGRGRRAVAFDYPGYGESDPAPVETTRDDYAEALLAAMDGLGIDNAHVCGLSLGGVIAIALHHAAPDRCRSLTLADSFAAHPEGLAIYERSVQASQSMPMRELAGQRAPMLLASDTPAAVHEEVIATMGAIDPRAYEIGARAVWLADQRDRAAAVRVPTLVLVGELDPVTPPALSRELAEIVPGARLETIAGASHISNLDRPDAFNASVEAFILEMDRKS